MRILVRLGTLLMVTVALSAAQAPRFEGLAREAGQARSENRLTEAIGLYRRALEMRPSWAEGWFYLGTLLYDRDDCRGAAPAFRKAAALSPKTGSAWVLLGLCEYKLGQRQQALLHLQRGRERGGAAEPGLRKVALYHEALLLLEKSEFERAQETLGPLGREGVESPELITALGMSVLRASPTGMEKADTTLRKAIEAAGRAEHQAAREEFDEALGAYEQLAADFPALPNVHYALGRHIVSRAHPEPERAVAAFERELKNIPNHVPALLGIAAVKSAFDPAGGLPYAEKAVRLNPRVPFGHYLLGLLLLDTGKTARAITELELARRALPNEPKVHFALGRAYAKAGRKQEAARARATFKRLNETAAAKDNQP